MSKADPIEGLLENLWSFNYRAGQVLQTGVVRAKCEAAAFLVAQSWCERNGFRAAARVTPMILADERILGLPPLGPDPLHAIPDAVGATTR